MVIWFKFRNSNPAKDQILPCFLVDEVALPAAVAKLREEPRAFTTGADRSYDWVAVKELSLSYHNRDMW